MALCVEHMMWWQHLQTDVRQNNHVRYVCVYLVEWAQKIGQRTEGTCALRQLADELFLPLRAHGHQRNYTMSTNPLSRHYMLACQAWIQSHQLKQPVIQHFSSGPGRFPTRQMKCTFYGDRVKLALAYRTVTKTTH
ncbi:hypothetical protein CBL_05526 [Carabus blaptoides fortunei]